MLYKAKDLKGYKLGAVDGEIGKALEFYFDDKHWSIRYLVAETGNWLIGKQVLISPYAIEAVNEEEKIISIRLTRKQIEDSPSLDSDKPISRQYEEAYYGYYGWPMYWYGPFMWGRSASPATRIEGETQTAAEEERWDPNLRSTREVTGYHIQAQDDEIGHVDDFIVDDQSWAIRYLVIDTRNWWPGKKVLISRQWIDRISWTESKVFVNLTRESVKQAPEYSDESPLTRDYETQLHHYYNREGYWLDEPSLRNIKI
ncbi:MAG: PRC-barrel domain-containing protein [Candidatus Omnitrophota bacterium]